MLSTSIPSPVRWASSDVQRNSPSTFLVPLWVQNPKPVHDAHELTDLRNLCNAGEPLDLTAGNRANSSR
jgi:hypothetical protein